MKERNNSNVTFVRLTLDKSVILKQHIATGNEGKKPFKCEFCNTNFGQKYHLNRHVTTVHEGKKPYL